MRMNIEVFLLALFPFSLAQAQMNFKTLARKMPEEERYIAVLIDSRYCAYCIMQEKQINKHKTLRRRLDHDFYYVKGLAETADSIVFNHKKYVNPDPEDPHQVNDFVNIYGKDKDGNLAYPLWLFFDKNYRLILRFYGLMTPENISKVLDRVEKAGSE